MIDTMIRLHYYISYDAPKPYDICRALTRMDITYTTMSHVHIGKNLVYQAAFLETVGSIPFYYMIEFDAIAASVHDLNKRRGYSQSG
jgi:hypothetical protein